MSPHEQWLDRAWDDLQFARVGMEEGFHAQVCFLSQQVIEKCLKGYLISLDRLYPRTHKLIDLWSLCESTLEELRSLAGILRIIDEYYVPTRYPDAVPGMGAVSPTEDQAREALETAERVYSVVRKVIRPSGAA